VYALELTSNISALLLASGLIASMANVLTKGSVLTDNLIMQRIWAWTQCIAIDANVAGSILRTYTYWQEGERLKMWLYGLLSAVLLFTVAIVSNIESVQQTLNITLASAYTHVFVPVELLIWIRSIAIVLIIVAHAARHVQGNKTTGGSPAVARQSASQRSCGTTVRAGSYRGNPRAAEGITSANLAEVTRRRKQKTSESVPFLVPTLSGDIYRCSRMPVSLV
jgi:hypothetical protein